MMQNESEKLQILYELYEQPMYRIAFAVLKNSANAEDAVSDAFMCIIRNIGKINDPYSQKTKSYIITTIKNAAIDKYRHNSRIYKRVQPIDDSTLEIPDNSIDIENNITDLQNYEILDSLNDTDRKIMVMRCIKELSWREIAAEMSINEATVRKRFERARKKLSQLKGEIYNEK